MTNEWRPLGVDTEDGIAVYDALHDDVPDWMQSAFWAWVRKTIIEIRRYSDGSGRIEMLDTRLVEPMCQQLRIPLTNLRSEATSKAIGQNQLSTALMTLAKHTSPLQIADYLLAHAERPDAAEIEALLERSKSAWKVGIRAGKPGLERRVPKGVQDASDSVMERAGRAGVRLAKAWEELYGLDSNPSEAYRLSIMAVEDASIPVVSPKNTRATLGTVLSQIENQGNWKLPMEREHQNAPTADVLIGMMRVLWHGQHDRHGGQPTSPGNVSAAEATVAVSLAVTLVTWFDAKLVMQGGEI